MAAPKIPKQQILVVDDEPLVCDSITRMLAADGHVAETALNAAAALSTFGQTRFDLVILDYQMPDMSGYELARAIRRLSPDLPIVMITAYGEALALSDALRDVDVVISKPFGLRELRDVIAKLLTKE